MYCGSVEGNTSSCGANCASYLISTSVNMSNPDGLSVRSARTFVQADVMMHYRRM